MSNSTTVDASLSVGTFLFVPTAPIIQKSGPQICTTSPMTTRPCQRSACCQRPESRWPTAYKHPQTSTSPTGARIQKTSPWGEPPGPGIHSPDEPSAPIHATNDKYSSPRPPTHHPPPPPRAAPPQEPHQEQAETERDGPPPRRAPHPPNRHRT